MSTPVEVRLGTLAEVRPCTLAEVRLWGRTIGAVSLNTDEDVAAFQYDSDFARSGIQVAPLMMPASSRVYRFPELSRPTFHGLPGMLADCLPDKFGSALIDAWLATEGRTPESFNSVERLCYVGSRAMGALEFIPVTGPQPVDSVVIEVKALVALASKVLQNRHRLSTSFAEGQKADALRNILRVGTSAGGARAKAVIAWNRNTNEVRSGQAEADQGFEYWLLKFDGVTNNRDRELNDPLGYGAIEYAYSMMAKAAGIEMSECRLMEEEGRRHFMTRRFDRTTEGGKLHMQSLCALAHYDFNLAGAYSYEQAFFVMRQLDLPMRALEQQFRRMIFNVVARNQDDHVKNIAFLMDRRGNWSLSPAFDVTYSYNAQGQWTSTHQMSLNGKRTDFSRSDFRDCAKTVGLKRGRAEAMLDEVTCVVARWPDFAAQACVPDEWVAEVARNLRLKWR